MPFGRALGAPDTRGCRRRSTSFFTMRWTVGPRGGLRTTDRRCTGLPGAGFAAALADGFDADDAPLKLGPRAGFLTTEVRVRGGRGGFDAAGRAACAGAAADLPRRPLASWDAERTAELAFALSEETSLLSLRD
jgi:hypothetical protein